MLKLKTACFLAGTVGTPTKIKDSNGIPLFVGDTVDIFVKERTRRINKEPAPIVDEKGEYYVMGIAACCNSNGTIDYGVTIKKVGSFKDLKVGQVLDERIIVYEE